MRKRERSLPAAWAEDGRRKRGNRAASFLAALLLLILSNARGEPFVFREGVRFDLSPEEVQRLEAAGDQEQVPSVFTLSWGRLEYTGVDMYGAADATLVYIFDEATRSRLREILVVFPSDTAHLKETFGEILGEMTVRFGQAQADTNGGEGMPGRTPTLRAMGLPLFRKTGAAVVRLCQWLFEAEEGFAVADLYACRDTFGEWQVRLGFALLSDPEAEADRQYIEGGMECRTGS